ncbi:MAG: DUF255 domain-containing protein [Candidatus Eisenbacteria bacterium]|uniref:DUF255 domain-containing protein n=1 Tax=Eiseniibacteriota bacterium TaxID=2212470 RepID=A0A849SMN5_UNCEI|nr:DUF255 domain-containing protein [Candidatus Eisenbacteria bacterium]
MRFPTFFAVLSLALTCLAAPALAEPTPLAWRPWDAGLEEASRGGRHVVVDVYTDWCGWCKRMERTTYGDPAVRSYLDEHFVVVKLDAESPRLASYLGRKQSLQSIASEFGVSGYPTTLFLNSAGKNLVKAPGYLGPERFLQVLRYVAEGHLEGGVSFEDFLGGGE